MITPHRGPRVRWGTILIDAGLEAGIPTEEKCGKCTECVEACPSQAFTGKNFISSEPRESRMIAKRCDQFLDQRVSNIGKRVCGVCVYICPFGKTKGTQE